MVSYSTGPWIGEGGNMEIRPKPVRIVDRTRAVQQSRKSLSRPCAHPGCRQKTREGKPYCPEHIENLTQVKEILAQLEGKRAEEEVANLGGWKSINRDGITTHEILQMLDLHGPRTMERLARDLKLTEVQISSYIKALKSWNLVTTRRTARGSTIVSIIST